MFEMQLSPTPKRLSRNVKMSAASVTNFENALTSRFYAVNLYTGGCCTRKCTH